MASAIVWTRSVVLLTSIDHSSSKQQTNTLKKVRFALALQSQKRNSHAYNSVPTCRFVSIRRWWVRRWTRLWNSRTESRQIWDRIPCAEVSGTNFLIAFWWGIISIMEFFTQLFQFLFWSNHWQERRNLAAHSKRNKNRRQSAASKNWQPNHRSGFVAEQCLDGSTSYRYNCHEHSS